MCGIVAYIGEKDAYPFLINGLRRLEYRGYDSAGVALMNHDLKIYKKEGKVQELEQFVADKDISGTTGIGHTRWATHGKPSDINAHPHRSEGQRLALVHNGIIENHQSIKEALMRLGHTFESKTDTEVLVHLISEYQEKDQLPLAEAVRQALHVVQGAYAIVVMDRENPDTLVAARKASPLVLGVGKGEFLIASDATPLVGFTNQVIYLGEEEVCEAHRNGSYKIYSLDKETKDHPVHQLELEIEELEKGGYDHFMLKEIFQQPESIADCMRGRLNANEGWVRLGGVEEHASRIAKANRLLILGCGTSWHAGMIGELSLIHI